MGLTPMMQQYLQIKEECNDCILFFRLGDFYEMFFEDAKIVSKELELVLTGRDCGLDKRAPMCGVPYHAANSYIARLVNKGYKIAICEQLEDPASAKGIVKRGITKVITPGTYTDSSFLEDNKNNYIMSIYIHDDHIGMCFSDISTGEFYCTEIIDDLESILNEISKFKPIELICQDHIEKNILNSINERFAISITKKDENYFTQDVKSTIQNQFKDENIEKYSYVVSNSINGLLKYIYETQKIALTNINNIEFYNVFDYLYMDINTRRNLELTENLMEKTKKNSLLWVLDKTNTAMGGRQLRKWIEQPLINKTEIQKRLDAVDELVNNISMKEGLKENLKEVYDIERIVGKISSQSVNAKELISLRNSLEKIPSIKLITQDSKCNLLKEMHSNLDELKDVSDLLSKSINENPPLSVKEGNIIKDGYNKEIDELRSIKTHGKEWIASLEKQERDYTGIKSLKVGYNKVFGYYIEITKSNLDSVPEGRYIRKQTLANSERYITPELKEMEDKIIGAEDKLINLEYKIFAQIRKIIEAEIKRMKKSAEILSKLDCLISFAEVSLENKYSKPTLTDGNKIYIKEGRHPVVEKVIKTGAFVSNDTLINNTSEQLLLITGPNMSGKSTYIRQVALIVIMTQIGCFVPAKEASMSICDKVFTRIGASDDLAAGKSTFMVEMWEVSNILKNATNNSLLILDEVGRGTSTFDGLSIAWAVVEYICENENLRSKTLFATHYHELIELEGKVKGVKNYSVAVKKIDNEIVFLRKIMPGGTDESYGIEVAKLAGLPQKVTSRAEDLLYNLEKNNDNNIQEKELLSEVNTEIKQMGFKDLERDSLIEEISSIDIMNKTPIECMNILYNIINKSKNL